MASSHCSYKALSKPLVQAYMEGDHSDCPGPRFPTCRKNSWKLNPGEAKQLLKITSHLRGQLRFQAQCIRYAAPPRKRSCKRASARRCVAPPDLPAPSLQSRVAVLLFSRPFLLSSQPPHMVHPTLIKPASTPNLQTAPRKDTNYSARRGKVQNSRGHWAEDRSEAGTRARVMGSGSVLP